MKKKIKKMLIDIMAAISFTYIFLILTMTKVSWPILIAFVCTAYLSIYMIGADEE